MRLPLRGRLPLLVSSRQASSYYDAVVVGGGLVGNAMACSIGKSPSLSNKRVLLLEGGQPRGLPKKAPETYSNRVSAVSPVSIELFKKLGIWDQLQAYRVKKVSNLHVLDSCSSAEVKFDQPTKGQEIAYIIENDAIVGALSDQLQNCKGVEVKTGAAVSKCSLPSSMHDLATVELEGGETIETALVIGADGARSRVRDAMAVDYTSWNYEQSGVVATLRVETSGSNSIAWQRFCRLGPIALLPLSDTLSSLVWTTSPEDAKRLTTMPEDQFIDELNHALFTSEEENSLVNQSMFLFSRALCPSSSSTLSRSLPPHVISLQTDTRASFPLGFGHAHSYVSARGAVLGDAAHRVHPLAGQGVNLGWNDVILMTRTLEKAEREGADWGSVTYLADYDSAAQRHNVPVMVSIDWLNRLYRTDAPAVVMLRSLGLAAFNRLTPLKDLIVQQMSISK